MSSLEHRLDIFEVDLFICTTRKEWNARRRKTGNMKNIESPEAGFDGLTWEASKAPNQEIWMFIDETGYPQFGPVWLAGLAAHEAVHATEAILLHRELKMKGEMPAYVVQYLVKMILHLVDEKLNGPIFV